MIADRVSGATGNTTVRSVGVVLLLLGGVLSGCAERGTRNPHDDWVLVSSSQEQDMGRDAARRLEENIGLYEADPLDQYVDNVGSRVAVYSERPDLDYEFRILDTFIVNALALPGGYVYLTRGLLKRLDNEAELAGVLAHEVAHVAAYHAVKRQQWSVVTMLATLALAAETGGAGLGGGLAAQDVIQRGYTRSSEEEADRLGMRYLSRAGYDPSGLRSFLEELQRMNDRVPNRDLLFLRTHPFLVDRIRTAKRREPEMRQLVSDQPNVGRARFRRTIRRHLMRPKEEAFLEHLEAFVEAYRRRDLAGLKDRLHPDFRLGDEDEGGTIPVFVDQMRRRFDGTRRIEYDYQLMDLDVGDTNASVTYEFESKRWETDREQPVLNNGYQKLIWRTQEGQWLLIRLR